MILLGIDVSRDQILRMFAVLLVALCCGCAARGEPRSVANLDGVPIKVVEQWRHDLIDAARTIFAGDPAAGRERVIDVTRSMHTFGVGSASGNAAGLERVAADKSTPPIVEDSPDVRAVLAKAQAAIAEMDGGK